MKTLLQLKTSQQLKMTPQLQQAIRLLQLSTAELNLEIREALESNMMLEIDEPDVDVTDQGIDLELEDKTPEIEISPSHALEGNQAYDEHASSFIHSGDVSDIEGAHLGSLKAHLLWQLNLLNLSDIDYVIAVSIIDAIDNRGRLSCSLDEIKETLRGSIEPIPEIDEINLVLKIIQEFDPIGVGARTLSECLLLQLAELPKDTPLLNEACLCVDQHMSLLGARNYQDILDNLSIRKDELIHILRLIKDLNPRPGEQYGSVSKDYIVPDVFVFWEKGGWNIELNNEAVPKIRVNLSYSNLARKIEKKEDQLTIKTHLHEARWLIKSIESRNDTLSRVARAIVEHQSAFLAFGEEAMKPLVLNDIASSLDMHESTISRITTQKYMHTPRGVFELKYFFLAMLVGLLVPLFHLLQYAQ